MTMTTKEIKEIKDHLSQPLDVLDHEWLNHGKINFVYLRTPVIEHLLDEYAPGWGTSEPVHEIIEADKDGDRPILIRFGLTMPWGSTYWGVGGANKSLGAKNSPERLVNNYKAARKDAEKIAARQLGIGRWLDSGEIQDFENFTGIKVVDAKSLKLYLRYKFPDCSMFDDEAIEVKRELSKKLIKELNYFENGEHINYVLNNHFKLKPNAIIEMYQYWTGIDKIYNMLAGFAKIGNSLPEPELGELNAG